MSTASADCFKQNWRKLKFHNLIACFSGSHSWEGAAKLFSITSTFNDHPLERNFSLFTSLSFKTDSFFISLQTSAFERQCCTRRSSTICSLPCRTFHPLSGTCDACKTPVSHFSHYRSDFSFLGSRFKGSQSRQKKKVEARHKGKASPCYNNYDSRFCSNLNSESAPSFRWTELELTTKKLFIQLVCFFLPQHELLQGNEWHIVSCECGTSLQVSAATLELFSDNGNFHLLEKVLHNTRSTQLASYQRSRKFISVVEVVGGGKEKNKKFQQLQRRLPGATINLNEGSSRHRASAV